MNRIYTIIAALFLSATISTFAAEGIKLNFARSGTDASSTNISITNGNITAGTTGTRWKVYTTADATAYYFKSADTGKTLIIDGDSLFTFGKMRNSYARNTQIYNNPCGYLADNYITTATLTGDDVLKTITYEATSKPSNWHVLYTLSRGEIAENDNLDIDITLAQAANEYLEVYAYFDWNPDGVFETSQAMQIEGNIIVSTDAEYTFTVDHNIALTAYFTPRHERQRRHYHKH